MLGTTSSFFQFCGHLTDCYQSDDKCFRTDSNQSEKTKGGLQIAIVKFNCPFGTTICGVFRRPMAKAMG